MLSLLSILWLRVVVGVELVIHHRLVVAVVVQVDTLLLLMLLLWLLLQVKPILWSLVEAVLVLHHLRQAGQAVLTLNLRLSFHLVEVGVALGLMLLQEVEQAVQVVEQETMQAAHFPLVVLVTHHLDRHLKVTLVEIHK
jgi:hypothetical protein